MVCANGPLQLAYSGPRELRAPLVGIVGTLFEHFVGGAEWSVVDEERLSVGGEVPPPPPVSAPMHGPAAADASISGEEAVGLFGGALAAGDFDHDGLVDLVIGSVGAGERGASPRAGSVRVLYGRGTVGELSGGGPLARFGSRVAVLDFNLDGIDDLAISAPGASGWNVSKAGASPYPFDGEPTYRHFGAVYVVLGSATVPLGARLELMTTRAFTGLGSALATGDVDGDGHDDLLLGSPACRLCGPRLAVTSSAARRAGERIDGGAIRRSTSTCEAMATALRAGWRVARADWHDALIGAPHHRANASCIRNCEIVGRVYGFDVATATKNVTAARFTITGTSALPPGGTTPRRRVAAIAAPDAAVDKAARAHRRAR